jgi:hypothetical protein
MRTCIFYKSDEEFRPNFQFAHTGVFHRWGTLNGDTVAIVEDSIMQVYIVPPPYIRFTGLLKIDKNSR